MQQEEFRCVLSRNRIQSSIFSGLTTVCDGDTICIKTEERPGTPHYELNWEILGRLL
jgi:hypothetical protein